jgi:hypothetical protein
VDIAQNNFTPRPDRSGQGCDAHTDMGDNREHSGERNAPGFKKLYHSKSPIKSNGAIAGRGIGQLNRFN